MIDCSAQELVKLAASGLDQHEAEALLDQFAVAAEAGEVIDTETRVEFDRSGKWLRVIGEAGWWTMLR